MPTGIVRLLPRHQPFPSDGFRQLDPLRVEALSNLSWLQLCAFRRCCDHAFSTACFCELPEFEPRWAKVSR